MRDLVALVLEVLDPRDLQLHVGEVRGELVEGVRGLEDDLGGTRELREKALLARKQLDHGAERVSERLHADFTGALTQTDVLDRVWRAGHGRIGT